MRFLATLLLTIALAAVQPPAGAQERGALPDFGSSAGSVLGPAQQEEYGRMLLAQLRHYDMVLEDPLVDSWIRSLGGRLGASSDNPSQSYTFFMMKDRSINAFATLGGYVGTNAGLVLTAGNEDEVAAVLAHEVAHVTQNHVLRSVERAQRDSVPILLAMLGAIAVAQSAGGNSSDDAAMAAMAGAQGLIAQRQIDYTRSNESEADRLGMRTLSRSGYDPEAMAGMFERMQAASRTNQGGDRERLPDYLRTHPVTVTRISEARERAEQLERDTVTTVTTTPGGSRVERRPRDAPQPPGLLGAGNPLLPGGLDLSAGELALWSGTGQFGWARERLRVLSANTPQAAIREYEQLAASRPLDPGQRYGLAVARMRAGDGNGARRDLQLLLADDPDELWLVLAMAEAESRAGMSEAADARLAPLSTRMPDNRAVALTRAGLLAERGTAEAGRLAQAVLRPLNATAANDPIYQRTFARASELAGDPVRAGEAWAEADYLGGRAERALVQLHTLRKRDDLDYYARARIDARIAAITPEVLELKRQGVRDEDLRRGPQRR